MDEDQHLAFNLAISGHNLLITGQAGIGKTYLVKKIINFLRNKKKTKMFLLFAQLKLLQHNTVAMVAKHFTNGVVFKMKLDKLPGEMTVYSSTDEGSPYYLNQIIAPKNIGLKVGCQVILLKNLNNFLVNGLRGTVSKLFEQSAEIKFPVTDKIFTVNIVSTTFTVYDPVSKIEVAKRLQLPIKLAYAITIHKSQGMTIENLVVHCQHINQPGQLGVAVGRAVSTDGLKIVNFNKNYCKMHPNYVSEFYKSFSVGEIKDDLSCCKQTFSIDTCLKESESDNSSNLSDCYCDDSDFSDFELDEMNNSAVEDETLMSKDALKSVLLQFEDTPAEDQINKFQSKIFAQYRFYDDWFHEQFSIMEDISLNTFLEGEDERYFIRQLSDYIPLQPAPSLFSLNCDLDPAGKGKIRYVSGYVVAKLKYNLSKKIRNSLFVKGKETDIKIYKCQMEIFNSLCCSYNDLLQDCDDPGSLEEIKRKQNQNESLCNITNEAFAFFQNLEHKCRTKLTHQNLVNFRKHLFKDAKEGLINDSELYQSWISCVVSSQKSSETENSQDDIGELLQSLVTNCENYLTLFEFVDTLFLKIKFRNRKKEEIVNAIVNHFLNVDTENLPNTELLVTPSQCEPHASTSYSEPGLVQPENVTTKLCKSNIKRKGKAKGRGKGKAKKIKKTNDEETDENNCGICCKTYITNEERISCDQCFLWYHRDCVNIEDNEWIKYSNDEEPYTCPIILMFNYMIQNFGWADIYLLTMCDDQLTKI
ncbi:hypothetical protein KUTeg_000911 [Tegillarca granosa]|uniref:DNA helicase Pif1-like 2B domain-containing protein n=1 Tax=Tegillarca granosa TaxID=220873 RepID=A0ABQ9FZ54_TEGGR|nr:hypothetical protein KUTeg_000911 [Tegillarca granosa]